jgi:acetoin utilization deacetylase AcuC-like enzyme
VILYSPDCVVGLIDFGILIPSRHDKARTVYEYLRSGPLAAAPEARWRRDPAGNGIGRPDLERVHTRAYVDRLFGDGLEAELVRSYELFDKDGRPNRYDPSRARFGLQLLFQRVLKVVSGTWECGVGALESGFTFFLGGGMHHAMPEHGSGFCVVNDICIALRRLQADHAIRTAWVIDVDAHKGDGTAVIMRDDPTITTLSIHMGSGWPLDEPEYDARGIYNPSWTPSDIEIPVYPGEAQAYLPRLEAGLAQLEKFGRPDIAYVVDGADPDEQDELPSTASLKLKRADMLKRDLLVYDFLVSRGIPAAFITGGGYGANAWKVHAQFLEKVLPARLQRPGDS